MINEYLRPFWITGLNDITGKTDYRFLDLINRRKSYVIYQQIKPTAFTLNITDTDSVLRSIACDINRFGCASIESINEINYKKKLPHSHAWKCINAYYGAYYAAHSILRIIGISCTNFEANDLQNVELIADLYGLKNNVNITKGYYKCSIDINNNLIDCIKISTSRNLGSHEQMWLVFLNFIDHFIIELAKKAASIEVQSVITKIQELKDNLTYMGYNGGNWLSRVRNDINYKHVDGIWFPYKDVNKYLDDITKLINKWDVDPMQIDISSYVGKYYMRFASTCVFLISLFRSMAIEMSKRCSKRGHSFHENGSISLINHIK